MRVNDSVMVQHLSVDDCLASDEANEVAEVSVANIDHRGNGEDSVHWFLLHISFIST